MDDRDLVKSFLKLHALQVAVPGLEFELASGERSRFYCDVKRAALSGRTHQALATVLFDTMIKHFGPVEAVAGVVLGGCHLASVVALYAQMKHGLQLDVLYIRPQAKEHGTRKLIERPAMTGEQHVVLIEDVITTGDSSGQAAHSIREAGFDVRGILTLVDRRKEPTSHWRGQYPIHAVFPFSEIIEDDL